MIDRLISLVAPHYCTSCGDIGRILCSNCKYDIVSEPYGRCLNCDIVCNTGAKCTTCIGPYTKAWCVGERRDTLRMLVDNFKFEHLREVATVSVELLDAALPHMADVTVVAVPTIPAHIRQRGFDHAKLLARGFARRRKLRFSPCLVRKTFTRQRGATKKQRQLQAKTAFGAKNVQKGATYLLIDDIYTTGATLKYASQTLLDAGAAEVWIAVLARQPSTEVD